MIISRVCFGMFFLGCALATQPLRAEGDDSEKSLATIPSEVPRQGEYGDMTKWDKYPYEIKSSYPYLTALPPPGKIPELIEYIAKGESEAKPDAGVEVAKTQLSCLARVAFFKDPHGRKFDARAWLKWWKETGSDYFKRVDAEGIRNEDAWHALVRFEKIPCPEYKILLPKEWRFAVRFRTGDYFGIVNEVITMERTKDKVSLKRRFSTGTGRPYQYEVWDGGRIGGRFSFKEADDFLCTMIYAIDHPWFVKRFVSPRNHFVEGRSWRHYYSGTEWTGVVLPDGRIWLNDDPWNWHATHGGGGRIDIQFKTVYPLLCQRFRDRDFSWVPDLDAPKENGLPGNVPKSPGTLE